MSDDHLPDLRHARNWLDEIRTDLLAARETARTSESNHDALVAFVALAERHAATLGDIIARGEIVPQRAPGKPAPQDEPPRDALDIALGMFGRADDADELPTNAQLVAMRRRMRKDVSATVFIEPFDLPSGYVLVRYSDGFECGISREGDVSS